MAILLKRHIFPLFVLFSFFHLEESNQQKVNNFARRLVSMYVGLAAVRLELVCTGESKFKWDWRAYQPSHPIILKLLAASAELKHSSEQEEKENEPQMLNSLWLA